MSQVFRVERTRNFTVMYTEMQRDEEPHDQLACQDDLTDSKKCIAFVSTIDYNTLEQVYGFQGFIQEIMRYGKNSEYICKDRTGCKRAG